MRCAPVPKTGVNGPGEAPVRFQQLGVRPSLPFVVTDRQRSCSSVKGACLSGLGGSAHTHPTLLLCLLLFAAFFFLAKKYLATI